MVQTRARIAAKRCLGNLFPVLPHQLVNDIFSYASDDGPRVMGEKTHMRIVIQQHDDVMRERDDLFRDNERLDALLVVAGMSRPILVCHYVKTNCKSESEHFFRKS